MTGRPKGVRRKGRGALFAIGALFLASGAIRLADGTGAAIARQVDTLTSPASALDGSRPSSCEAEPEIERILVSLRKRVADLDRREMQIDERMQALNLADKEIQYNLAALAEAEHELEALIALADGAAESDIDRLTEVYERMKPAEAAALFEAMDPEFASGFLARMKPSAAATVLAGLSPERAYMVSVMLAGRNMNVPTE